MEKIKFIRLYDIDGEISGYRCGSYYIMKHYTWGNNYEWIINKDGTSSYFDSEFSEALEKGEVIICENLKAAKQKVKELIQK